MLKKLSFENYKAFEKGSIEIKPITLLLGANSVGKSSILQLLLLLQQTSEADKNYKSALKLNGGFVSLGEGLNLIRKRDASKPLVLSFDFKNNELLSNLSSGFLSTYCTEILMQATHLSRVTGKTNSIFSVLLKSFGIPQKREMDYHLEMLLVDKNNDKKIIDRNYFIELVEFLNKESVKESKIINDEARYIFHYRRFAFNGFSNISKNKDEFILAYDFLLGLTKMNLNQDFNITYILHTATDNTIRIKEVILKANNKEVLAIEFNDDINLKTINIKSPITNNHPLISSLPLDRVGKILDASKTIFNFLNFGEDYIPRENDSSIFSSILCNILYSYVKSIKSYFTEDKINYVSPLRAHPKRYYFLDKAKINKYLDTLDGDALTEILRENIFLKTQVNTWFSKFNLQIDVDQLRDIIHKLVVRQNSLSLDITDVGFGISQVLPVIVQGFLSSRESLTIIEQPEIHLHPKMQADLADLFIDIVLTRTKKDSSINKYLLIETHSEYLLKRLRRRMSEGVISSKQVAIYLIDPQQKNLGANLRSLEIEEKGNFEWPIDFYADELIKDTFEFLKNQ